MESQSATVMVIDEVNNMQSKIEELDSKMAAMGQWKEEKEGQVAAQISELRAAFQEQTQEQAKSTQAQITRLATDFFRLQSSTAKNTAELDEWVERAMLAEGGLREAQEKVDQLAGSNRQLESEVTNQKQRLEEAKEQMALKESALEEELELKKKKVEELQGRLEDQTKLKIKLNWHEKALSETLHELAKEEERGERHLASSGRSIDRLNADLAKAQAAHKQAQDHAQALTLEMTVVKAEAVRGREREAELDRKCRQRATLVKEMQEHLNAMVIKCSIDEEAEVESDSDSSEDETLESDEIKQLVAPLSPPLASEAPAAVPDLPETTTQVEPAEKKEVATSTSA